MCAFIALLLMWTPEALGKVRQFHTDYFGLDINEKGYIVGMYNTTRSTKANFSPADRPSPLMKLYDKKFKRYYYPVKAQYNSGKKMYTLDFLNGSTAQVRFEPKKQYFKLTMESLTHRDDIGAIQWGNYYTTITNVLGEIIGVARDTSTAVNYAIGVMALDDNTIGGEAHYTSEGGAGGYIDHSPDPVRHPLPLELHEGQQFTMGGDGINDVAFYNRKESYYRILYGNSANVDIEGRINIRYFSRDRRKGDLIYSPEGVPILSNNEPNHLMRQDVPGVDFIGSSIALWGSPDTLALSEVIRNIVKAEGLPYPTFEGKWVKDPSSFIPDLWTYGGKYDSIHSYALQMGLHVIHAYDLYFLKANRGNGGWIDGPEGERKPFKVGDRAMSHREYADFLAKQSILLGRTCITNSLAPGTLDINPFPSDSICIQHRRKLAADISATDTMIYVDDPLYLDEIACWEGHSKELNMVKIGKELIHYLGVSKEAPYRLLHVTRGYWNTEKTAHAAGSNVDKMQSAVGGGYTGLIPNLELQELIGQHYGDVAARSGVRCLDFDGQEFLFHNGFGTYSVKRFFRNLTQHAAEQGVPYMRFTGATLSEGSWHYQSEGSHERGFSKCLMKASSLACQGIFMCQ